MKFRYIKIVLALIMLVALSGCMGGTPTAWESAGFTGKEKYYDTWKVWEMSGFTPEEADSWRKEGFGLQYPKPNPIDWKKNSYTPMEAKEWINAGFRSVSNVNDWKTKGITLQDINGGFNTRYYPWIEQGLTIDDVKQWSNFLPVESPYSNLTIKMLLAEAKEKGVSSEVFAFYKESLPYFSFRAIINFATDKTRIEYIKKLSLMIDELDVEETKRINFRYTEYKILALIDVEEKYLKMLSTLPVDTLQDKKKVHTITKYCNKIEPVYLSKVTPFSTKNKCYTYLGRVTKVRDRKILEIEECVKTSNSYDNCMDGRVSLMKFEKGIPDNLTRGAKYRGVVISSGHIETFLYGNSSENTELLFPLE